ncbi:hypothetical protein BHK98_07760 [Hornefia porci]|uniref:SAF domain-containing protein n=1 Tax=Hornefia porci TaxID=2652292 RepID=A0A1Q9JIB3_9FIRM|nr:altronate dehydratase family protein [Hornefia porci]OLR55962.1 hypothetical protein BHK98_07760 [Hornefia porci]
MKAMKLYPADTVALAADELKRGDVVSVDGEEIEILDDIPKAHKFALKDFEEGESIRKYDNIIGTASRAIRKGEWVHSHNEVTTLGSDKEYCYEPAEEAVYPGTSSLTYMGYKRDDGSCGIRNYIALISTVFCANGPLSKLAAAAAQKYSTNDHFDGFVALEQEFGCSQTGTDLVTTERIIANVARSANFGGVLFVSLGCEMAIPSKLEKYLEGVDRNRIRVITLQESEDELAEGLDKIGELVENLEKDHREPLPISSLHVAVNCGGSDGYSGITANTMLGTLCDNLVSKGATVNMTEVPEMMGAEHILMNRAKDEETFNRIVKMIRDYNAYFARYGEKAADNPTQGNKAGGLTTLEEKSLGCIQKGGHCAVMGVYDYGERVDTQGYVLVSGPGNDLAGVSGQIAAGAVLTIFTTGRGTPCGFAGPTFRLSSNSELARRKPTWIDFDAGRFLGADKEKKQALNRELYDAVLDCINGALTKNERNGYFQMGALKDGVTL